MNVDELCRGLHYNFTIPTIAIYLMECHLVWTSAPKDPFYEAARKHDQRESFEKRRCRTGQGRKEKERSQQLPSLRKVHRPCRDLPLLQGPGEKTPQPADHEVLQRGLFSARCIIALAVGPLQRHSRNGHRRYRQGDELLLRPAR